jgi:hypothetical protein
MRTTLFLVVLISFSAHSFAAPSDVERLAACLTGDFSTIAQARSNKNFRDITLHVIPIWPDRTDGHWFYGEQSLTGLPDHPYRQRIYQLTAHSDTTLELRLFDLPDPVAATGAWKDPSLLAKLTPAGLDAPAGCTLILHPQPDGSFKGGTDGKSCPSSLRGATYATAEFVIDAQQTIIWERGFNASDVQVWGSAQGGYIFRKLVETTTPPP